MRVRECTREDDEVPEEADRFPVMVRLGRGPGGGGGRGGLQGSGVGERVARPREEPGGVREATAKHSPEGSTSSGETSRRLWLRWESAAKVRVS